MGEAKELTKKKAFKMPHTLVIIFMIIFAAVLFTWVVPSGAYVRFEDAVTGRNLIDPESFHYVENTPVNPLKIMNYVIDGFMDAADLIFMLMFAGGAFHLITESGALQASIAKVARKFSNRFYIHPHAHPDLYSDRHQSGREPVYPLRPHHRHAVLRPGA